MIAMRIGLPCVEVLIQKSSLMQNDEAHSRGVSLYIVPRFHLHVLASTRGHVLLKVGLFWWPGRLKQPRYRAAQPDCTSFLK
jgi:hypothetical protein